MKTTTMLCFSLVSLLFLMSVGKSSSVDDGSLMEKLKNGFQMAGKIFGLDTASGVAQLVSSAFGGRKSHNNKNKQKQDGLFGKILNMLSFDISKVGAIVMNTFIFLAELINTSLLKKNPALPSPSDAPRRLRDGSPFEWAIGNDSPRFKSLLVEAKDEHLTDRIVEMIKEQSNGEDTACVQLLVCQISPFVRGMQRALDEGLSKKENSSEKDDNKTNKLLNLDALFRYLPEFEEFKRNGDVCKRRHEECRILD